MIASRRRQRYTAVLASALAVVCSACATPAAAPLSNPLEPLPELAAAVPEEADRIARDIASSLWLGDSETLSARAAAISAIDADRTQAGEPATGLYPYALDARNALIPNAVAWREAQEMLLERRDLDSVLHARLEHDVADDPLALAEERIRDARVRRWGGYANAVTQSLGSGISNPTLLPLKVAQALVKVGVQAHLADELSLQERQALEHWKSFARENPGAEETADVIARIESAQKRWLETQRDQSLRSARAALEGGDSHTAASFAQRALRHIPDDEEAQELLVEADVRVARWDEERARSLGALPTLQTSAAAEGPLWTALWQDGPKARALAEKLLATRADTPLQDEPRFVLATLSAERGEEIASWAAFDALAEADDSESNMARHARTLVSSLDTNPYRGFEFARDKAQSDRVRWLFLGPLAGGARDRDLPGPVEWLAEIPSIVGIVWGIPERLIQFPFTAAQRRSPGVLARRYLEQNPEGAHADEVRPWLLGYEQRRGNDVGAYQLARSAPGLVDAEELEQLRSDAARQAVDVALGEKRRDVRLRLLRGAAREFSGTEAGQEAGLAVRREIREYSPQQIRITRGFIEENPAVTGPEGLAIRRELLDGEVDNGELHPQGIALLGGRIIEFSFLAASGDEDDEPERVRERVSKERLARTVAWLGESTHQELRTDRDAKPEHDANRDGYLERARLGAVERPDLRPEAGSTYTYQSLEERFGVVRGRESLLPVELVLQGSFTDFTLGAFPRIRLPKQTPDSVLYR